MAPRGNPQPVHVTQKASIYSNNCRANLRHEELVRLVQERRGVYLGSTDVDFMLVWDHRKNVPVVLLISHGKTHDIIVSIWEPHYSKIPNGVPTAGQIWHAWRLALPLEDYCVA